MIAGAFACATPGVEVSVRETRDFRDMNFRSIAPGDGPPPVGFRRQPLPQEMSARAWEVMKQQLVPARWEFTDIEGPDLVVYFAKGRAPEDRVDEIDDETFVVDIFERETGERVWFGYAEEVTPLTLENVERVVSEMMLRFPKVPPRPVAY